MTISLAVLAEHGVNRLSVGVQSFLPGLLQALDRDHTPDDVRSRRFDAVRRRICNLSLDMIFGVPGQTLELWQATWSVRWPWSRITSPPMA